MNTITGLMATDRPARYAKQLASHWANRGPATEEDGATVMRWPTGQVIAMRPEHDALAVEVSVPDDADLERFARQADTIALRDAFLMAAETNRALARKAAACTQDDRALCA